MTFGTIRYMEWFKTRAGAKYDLCPSGAQPLGLDALELSGNDLELSGEDSYGYPPLLAAISRRFGVEEENVVSTLGTSQGLFLVCAALLSPGDRVVIEKPAYGPILAVPGAFETSIIRLERRYENGYQIDAEEFEAVLEPDTKLVVLTNLHNPSGALLSDSLIKSLAEIAAAGGASLLIDEVYRDFVQAEKGRTSFHLADNIMVISSLGKVYGLGDLRCGWALVPAELATRLRRIIDYINVEGVFIGERISTVAFDQLDELWQRALPRIDRNREIVRRFMEEEERLSRLSWVEPDGGVVCFPRVETGMTGDELADVLCRDYETAVVPGSLFEDPRHFRIGFGGDPETVSAGLENIGRALAG